jgi:hypothetical protein
VRELDRDGGADGGQELGVSHREPASAPKAEPAIGRATHPCKAGS